MCGLMMNRVVWLFVIFVLLRATMCTIDKMCIENFTELRLLNNLDKLLQQNRVKIADGIVLKKKHAAVHNQTTAAYVTCNRTSRNFIGEFDAKLRHVLETHDLEFNFTSMAEKGKNFFCDDKNKNLNVVCELSVGKSSHL
jgi:hypothetical protein